MTIITIIVGAIALFFIILIILMPVFIHGIYNQTKDMANTLKRMESQSKYQSSALFEIHKKQ